MMPTAERLVAARVILEAADMVGGNGSKGVLEMVDDHIFLVASLGRVTGWGAAPSFDFVHVGYPDISEPDLRPHLLLTPLRL
jgi:hypothetical protein